MTSVVSHIAKDLVLTESNDACDDAVSVMSGDKSIYFHDIFLPLGVVVHLDQYDTSNGKAVLLSFCGILDFNDSIRESTVFALFIWLSISSATIFSSQIVFQVYLLNLDASSFCALVSFNISDDFNIANGIKSSSFNHLIVEVKPEIGHVLI
jgi:hypothetical protein